MSKDLIKPEDLPKQESFQKSEKNVENFHRKGKKTRWFSLITYLDEKQIVQTLAQHKPSIRACLYIHHDKDENEPHHHVVIRTYATWSPDQIKRWFLGFRDHDGKPINTLAEVLNDIDGMVTYLLHKDEKSIADGKRQYDVSDLKDFGILHAVKVNASAKDSSFECLQDVLAGVDVLSLCKRYGRDYIFHRTAYEEAAELIAQHYNFGSLKHFQKQNDRMDGGQINVPTENER